MDNHRLIQLVALVAVAVLAAPAGAQLKCKSKQDKKTGEIGYSFVNKAGGTVVYSYSDLDPSPGRPHYTNWGSFANADSCQLNGKGRGCLVSNDAAEARVAPAGCKIYMADLVAGEKCELYIRGCQPASRPLPSTGYHAIGNNHGTAAVWDAEINREWHISPEHEARTLDDHLDHLDKLNGDTVIAIPAFLTLTDAGDLKLPTLHSLARLGNACVTADSGTGLATLCETIWPDPSQADNCGWSRTADPGQPGYAYVVCLLDDVAGGPIVNVSSSLVPANVSTYPSVATAMNRWDKVLVTVESAADLNPSSWSSDGQR